MENQEKTVLSLYHLALALATAVSSRFMSPEHGSNVWKDFLKKSGLDVAKKVPEEKSERR